MTLSPASSRSSGGTPVSYAVVREEQTSGTNGGGATANAWTTRVLNTIATDPSSIISSLAGNAFTLAAGTYILQALSPMFATNQSRIRLFNQTDSTVIVVGLSEYLNSGNSGACNVAASAVVTLAASKALRVDYYCLNAQVTNGLGVQAGIASINEVYTQVEVWKIA